MADPSEQMRDEMMEFARKSEKAITEAGRKWGETLCELVPGDGQSVRKVVEQAFDFTEAILKNQREFANSVLDKVLGESSSKRAPSTKRAPMKPASGRTIRKPVGHVGAA